jgi:hypothetical protein
MGKVLGFSWLALVSIEMFLGLSGLFLIEAAIAAVLLGGAFTFANAKGLLPGTPIYRDRILVEHAQAGLDVDRINRIRTRIKLLENEDVDRILALGPGKETA